MAAAGSFSTIRGRPLAGPVGSRRAGSHFCGVLMPTVRSRANCTCESLVFSRTVCTRDGENARRRVAFSCHAQSLRPALRSSRVLRAIFERSVKLPLDQAAKRLQLSRREIVLPSLRIGDKNVDMRLLGLPVMDRARAACLPCPATFMRLVHRPPQLGLRFAAAGSATSCSDRCCSASTNCGSDSKRHADANGVYSASEQLGAEDGFYARCGSERGRGRRRARSPVKWVRRPLPST